MSSKKEIPGIPEIPEKKAGVAIKTKEIRCITKIAGNKDSTITVAKKGSAMNVVMVISVVSMVSMVSMVIVVGDHTEQTKTNRLVSTSSRISLTFKGSLTKTEEWIEIKDTKKGISSIRRSFKEVVRIRRSMIGDLNFIARRRGCR